MKAIALIGAFIYLAFVVCVLVMLFIGAIIRAIDEARKGKRE